MLVGSPKMLKKEALSKASGLLLKRLPSFDVAVDSAVATGEPRNIMTTT